MDFWLFLTATAVAVSIDGMAAGFAVGLKSGVSLKFPCAAAAATLLLCMAAAGIGALMQDVLQGAAQIISPCALIVIGLVNFFKKEEAAVNSKECVALSFAVGLDAAAANLSLCLMGHTALWIPAVFAAAHFALVLCGNLLAGVSLVKKMKHTGKFAGVLLTFLGIIKFLG